MFDFAEALAKLTEYKKRMIERNLVLGKATCPRCKEKTLVCQIKGTKRHLWVSCRDCGFQMIE